MARNLEGLFAPYDSYDYCRRPCTTDKQRICRQNCSGPIQAELSVRLICNLVSVALSGPSIASIAVPVVAEVVAVAAVREVAGQYYAPVALC